MSGESLGGSLLVYPSDELTQWQILVKFVARRLMLHALSASRYFSPLTQELFALSLAMCILLYLKQRTLI